MKKRCSDLVEQANDCLTRGLYSNAISKTKKCIEIVDDKKVMITKVLGSQNFDMNLHSLFVRLLWLEYRSWNFNKVIEISSEINNRGIDIMKYSSVAFGIQLCDKLALLRNGADNIDPTQITTNFLKEVQTTTKFVRVKRKLIVNALRVSKNFDAAIDLDKNISIHPRFSEPLSARASLLVSYIERYRAEYHKRSRKDDYFLIKTLISKIKESSRGSSGQNQVWIELNTIEKDIEILGVDVAFALAQWFYLIHKLHDDDYKQECYNMAAGYLELVLGKMWMSKDDCALCDCAPSEVDIKSVCEECHVACFCSVDHQRLSWKKNAIDGMRIGHEALCPLMNTYRRLKLQIASPSSFRKECLGFLAYGLRLKGKCFAKHDELQRNGELSNTAYNTDMYQKLYAAEVRIETFTSAFFPLSLLTVHFSL